MSKILIDNIDSKVSSGSKLLFDSIFPFRVSTSLEVTAKIIRLLYQHDHNQVLNRYKNKSVPRQLPSIASFSMLPFHNHTFDGL